MKSIVKTLDEMKLRTLCEVLGELDRDKLEITHELDYVTKQLETETVPQIVTYFTDCKIHEENKMRRINANISVLIDAIAKMTSE